MPTGEYDVRPKKGELERLQLAEDDPKVRKQKAELTEAVNAIMIRNMKPATRDAWRKKFTTIKCAAVVVQRRWRIYKTKKIFVKATHEVRRIKKTFTKRKGACEQIGARRG